MALKEHTERLTKLFKLMMSTTAAGEVINARDSIVRMLSAEKMDIHDFANVLKDGFNPKEVVVWKPPTLDEPARDIADWCLSQIRCGAPSKGPQEIKFLTDMRVMWGKPSERQAAWLAAIHNRLVRRNGGKHND